MALGDRDRPRVLRRRACCFVPSHSARQVKGRERALFTTGPHLRMLNRWARRTPAGSTQSAGREIQQRAHRRRRESNCLFASVNGLNTLVRFHLPFPEGWPRARTAASPVNLPSWHQTVFTGGLRRCGRDVPALCYVLCDTLGDSSSQGSTWGPDGVTPPLEAAPRRPWQMKRLGEGGAVAGVSAVGGDSSPHPTHTEGRKRGQRLASQELGSGTPGASCTLAREAGRGVTARDIPATLLPTLFSGLPLWPPTRSREPNTPLFPSGVDVNVGMTVERRKC